MADDQDQPNDDQPEAATKESVEKRSTAEAEGATGGERLAVARREQQISVLEVAKELHLDEPKVRALERNEFEVLGAPVFAKGHLRKYSQLVGVDIDDVMADYYQLTRADGMPPVIVGRTKTPRELSPGPWIAVIIVVLAAAAAYWWFGVRQPAPEPTEAPPVLEERPADVEDDSAAPAASTSSEEPLQQEVSDDDAGAITESPAPEPSRPELPEGQVALALTFTGDCWTEITDADGRRLFFDMGRSGRSVDLSGAAPFTVLFGNADNVTVRVDGQPYEIPASSRSGRTARLTILNP